MKSLKIFSGRSNRPLAQNIAKCLGVPLGEIEIKNWSDDEVFVNFQESIKGKDIFLIQPTNSPAQNREELLIMLDAAKRASSRQTTITAVIPYFGYARQDRKDQSRVPITAKLMADLITTAGAHGVVTVDFHAAQEQGFFNIPVDHLYARPVFVRHLKNLVKSLGFADNPEELVVVAPDVGATKLARSYAKRLGTSRIAIIDKHRVGDGEVEVMRIIGDVRGADALIVDDLISTASTLVEAATALKEAGVKDVYALATHGVFSGEAGEAMRKIDNSPISKVFVTDTIDNSWRGFCEKIEIVSIAPLLAEAIKRIHKNKSVSSLFE